MSKPLEVTDTGDRCEEWRSISGYDGLYEVSSLGRFRQTRTRPRRPAGLQGHRRTSGYLGVSMTNSKGTRTDYLHRLVALAFVPNPDQKPQVNHLDGDKHNNRASNLEWVTQRENIVHGRRILGKEIGSSHHASKLNAQDVYAIRKLIRAGLTDSAIAKKIGKVTDGTIRAVRLRKTWFHIPEVE